MRATVQQLEQAAAKGGADADGLALIARRLGLATDAYEQAAGFMLANARTDLRALFMGSVPYLMLAGVVHAGWQIARAALACVEGVAAGTGQALPTPQESEERLVGEECGSTGG